MTLTQLSTPGGHGLNGVLVSADAAAAIVELLTGADVIHGTIGEPHLTSRRVMAKL